MFFPATSSHLICQHFCMSGCRELSRKKTRQRRGNGCRGGRDAVGVATKCRGADQYGGRGECNRGKRRTFERQGGTDQVCAILSRFGDLEPSSRWEKLFLYLFPYLTTTLDTVFDPPRMVENLKSFGRISKSIFFIFFYYPVGICIIKYFTVMKRGVLSILE